MALAVIAASEAHELHTWPGSRPHELARPGGVPRQTLHEWLAVVAQRPLQAEQARAEARRDDTPRLLAHVCEAITGHAVRIDVRRLHALAAQRLDRVPPELRNVHGHGYNPNLAGSLGRLGRGDGAPGARSPLPATRAWRRAPSGGR